MLNIKLNRHELMLCDIFGTVRRKNAMQFNYDRQVSKQDKYDMDIDGFKGEYIVAQYLNVMPDFSINEKKNPIDLHWNNKSIDVKSTRNPNGNIYITEYHKKKPIKYISIFSNSYFGVIANILHILTISCLNAMFWLRQRLVVRFSLLM